MPSTDRYAPRSDRRADEANTREFAELYRLHVNTVFRQLTRLVGPIPDREDLVQDVFLRLHRALPTFRGDASIATFIRKLTVNAAHDFFRRRRRRPLLMVPADGELPVIADDKPLQVDTLQRQHQLTELLAALDRLTPNKRIAFSLHVFEGLPPAEIAELVGARVPAVRQRIRHATKEVHSYMNKLRARRQHG